jgi:ABC-2 type transport system permease protein
MALFGLPMRGSWLELLLAISLFLAGALGTGLFISTVAESQLVAFQIVLIVAFLPTFLLSGFIFPIRSMPVPIQLVTYIVPAKYFLVALRGIVLKGVGISVFWPALGALVIYAVGVLGLASVRLARARG